MVVRTPARPVRQLLTFVRSNDELACQHRSCASDVRSGHPFLHHCQAGTTCTLVCSAAEPKCRNRRGLCATDSAGVHQFQQWAPQQVQSADVGGQKTASSGRQDELVEERPRLHSKDGRIHTCDARLYRHTGRVGLVALSMWPRRMAESRLDERCACCEEHFDELAQRQHLHAPTTLTHEMKGVSLSREQVWGARWDGRRSPWRIAKGISHCVLQDDEATTLGATGEVRSACVLSVSAHLSRSLWQVVVDQQPSPSRDD